MAWVIHTWSGAERVGAIRSPHFGPCPFEASANVDNADDFREGEAVLVELEGSAPTFLVPSLVPMHQIDESGPSVWLIEDEAELLQTAQEMIAAGVKMVHVASD